MINAIIKLIFYNIFLNLIFLIFENNFYLYFKNNSTPWKYFPLSSGVTLPIIILSPFFNSIIELKLVFIVQFLNLN